MSFRFRKSINLGGGVRLNFNKKSTGISFGTRGARISVNSNGRKTATFGIPGTGLYWSKSVNGSTNKNKISIWTIFIYIIISPFIIIYWLFRLYYYIFKYAYIGVKKLIEKIKDKNKETKVETDFKMN